MANKTSTEQTVLQMHSEGFSTGEISQQTGIPEGEVSLIISLAGRWKLAFLKNFFVIEEKYHIW